MAVDTDRKPILLTVDDEPGVSRAVARDLRRHYGEDYRVVRTESGPQALDTLRELKLRGDPVAVLLLVDCCLTVRAIHTDGELRIFTARS